MRRIAIFVGHPTAESFSRALAGGYRKGAEEGGNEIRFFALSDMKFDPILHYGYHKPQALEPDLKKAQAAIKWADHLVFVFPLWMGGLPALLKGFFERTFERGFAYELDERFGVPLLKG